MLLAADLAAVQPLAANGASDGFTAYCTGNLDGTGQCVNQENSQRYTCLIIPGQVIDCKSKGGKPFQCVWVNSVQANQAGFWCDPSVDSMLANELSSNALRQRYNDPLLQKPQDQIDSQNNAFGDVIGPDLGDPFKQPSSP